MLIHLHQKILLFKNDTHFLALQRSDTQARDLPGGQLEPPETHEAGIKREVVEECDIHDIHNLQILQAHSEHKPSKNKRYLTHLYRAKLESPITINLSDEHIAYQWCNRQTFLNKQMESYLSIMLNKITNGG